MVKLPIGPKKINQAQIKYLFRLKCIEEKCNVIFIGPVGVGKNHIATAIDAVNNLIAARHAGQLKQELRKYLKLSLMIMDELGFLPIDKNGADLLFQIISERYKRGLMVITTNRVLKEWPEIFNNDSILTSALLDRLLHRAEPVLIEGDSY